MNFVGVYEQLIGNAQLPKIIGCFEKCSASGWLPTYNLFLNLTPISGRITTEIKHTCVSLKFVCSHCIDFLWKITWACILAVTPLVWRWVCWFKALAKVHWLVNCEVRTWSCDFRSSKNKWMFRYSFMHVNFIYLKDSSPSCHLSGDQELELPDFLFGFYSLFCSTLVSQSHTLP